MKIVIISGSPRLESLTRRVAIHLNSQLEQLQYQTEMIDLSKWNIPPIQSVWKTPAEAPVAFQELAKSIESADAYLLVTPEYNGSYSPALKNLLDHFPKRNRKPFGLVTASPGAMGGMRAAQQLLLLVPALFGIAAPQFLLVPGVDKKFAESGELIDPSFHKSIDVFLEEFLWLCIRLTNESVPA
ncbi:MAG: NADPH-dependent FMN reductase [Bacteroidota bacterium]|jgi:NAD(P)H-dependent FMN reductase